MWDIQWIVAAIAVATGLCLGYYYLSAIDEGKTAEVASSDDRRSAFGSLVAESAKLAVPETADFLLAMAVDLYERKHKAYDALDEKAQKLVALIGGGASVFALFAGFNGGLHVVLTPLLVISALCFFVSLVLLLISLGPLETEIPAITEFNSVPVLRDPAFKPRIARRMIDTWQEITLGLTPILRRKGRFIYVSTFLIVAGATLLLTNFLILVARPNDKATTTQCDGKFQKLAQFSIACVENKK